MAGLKYKVIRDLAQYNSYCEQYEKLCLKDAKKYDEEIDLLWLLIRAFEAEAEQERGKAIHPVALLQDLVSDKAGMSQAAVARDMGITPQQLNDVLKYRRKISFSLVKIFAQYFAMKQEVFSQDYRLPAPKGNKEAKQKEALQDTGECKTTTDQSRRLLRSKGPRKASEKPISTNKAKAKEGPGPSL